ncbi:MAG: hypothetical protein ACRDLY_19000, partial [Thermoleophilaceae bacterium]
RRGARRRPAGCGPLTACTAVAIIGGIVGLKLAGPDVAWVLVASAAIVLVASPVAMRRHRKER